MVVPFDLFIFKKSARANSDREQIEGADAGVAAAAAQAGGGSNTELSVGELSSGGGSIDDGDPRSVAGRLSDPRSSAGGDAAVKVSLTSGRVSSGRTLSARARPRLVSAELFEASIGEPRNADAASISDLPMTSPANNLGKLYSDRKSIIAADYSKMKTDGQTGDRWKNIIDADYSTLDQIDRAMCKALLHHVREGRMKDGGIIQDTGKWIPVNTSSLGTITYSLDQSSAGGGVPGGKQGDKAKDKGVEDKGKEGGAGKKESGKGESDIAATAASPTNIPPLVATSTKANDPSITVLATKSTAFVPNMSPLDALTFLSMKMSAGHKDDGDDFPFKTVLKKHDEGTTTAGAASGTTATAGATAASGTTAATAASGTTDTAGAATSGTTATAGAGVATSGTTDSSKTIGVILHHVIRLPMPYVNRDFIVRQFVVRLRKGAFAVIRQGIDATPEVQALAGSSRTLVRAKLHFGAILLEGVDEETQPGTRVSVIHTFQPKGTFPARINNLMCVHLGGNIVDFLKRFVEKEQLWPTLGDTPHSEDEKHHLTTFQAELKASSAEIKGKIKPKAGKPKFIRMTLPESGALYFYRMVSDGTIEFYAELILVGEAHEVMSEICFGAGSGHSTYVSTENPHSTIWKQLFPSPPPLSHRFACYRQIRQTLPRRDSYLAVAVDVVPEKYGVPFDPNHVRALVSGGYKVSQQGKNVSVKRFASFNVGGWIPPKMIIYEVRMSIDSFFEDLRMLFLGKREKRRVGDILKARNDLTEILWRKTFDPYTEDESTKVANGIEWLEKCETKLGDWIELESEDDSISLKYYTLKQTKTIIQHHHPHNKKVVHHNSHDGAAGGGRDGTNHGHDGPPAALHGPGQHHEPGHAALGPLRLPMLFHPRRESRANEDGALAHFAELHGAHHVGGVRKPSIRPASLPPEIHEERSAPKSSSSKDEDGLAPLHHLHPEVHARRNSLVKDPAALLLQVEEGRHDGHHVLGLGGHGHGHAPPPKRASFREQEHEEAHHDGVHGGHGHAALGPLGLPVQHGILLHDNHHHAGRRESRVIEEGGALAHGGSGHGHHVTGVHSHGHQQQARRESFGSSGSGLDDDGAVGSLRETGASSVVGSLRETGRSTRASSGSGTRTTWESFPTFRTLSNVLSLVNKEDHNNDLHPSHYSLAAENGGPHRENDDSREKSFAESTESTVVRAMASEENFFSGWRNVNDDEDPPDDDENEAEGQLSTLRGTRKSPSVKQSSNAVDDPALTATANARKRAGGSMIHAMGTVLTNSLRQKKKEEEEEEEEEETSTDPSSSRKSRGGVGGIAGRFLRATVAPRIWADLTQKHDATLETESHKHDRWHSGSGEARIEKKVRVTSSHFGYASTLIDVPFSIFQAWLTDDQNQSGFRKAKYVDVRRFDAEIINDHSYLDYRTTANIWPVQDRDSSLRHIAMERGEKEFYTVACSYDNAKHPLKEGVLRVGYSSVVRAKKLSDGKCEMTFLFCLQDSGKVPAWFIKSHTLKLLALVKQAKDDMDNTNRIASLATYSERLSDFRRRMGVKWNVEAVVEKACIYLGAPIAMFLFRFDYFAAFVALVILCTTESASDVLTMMVAKINLSIIIGTDRRWADVGISWSRDIISSVLCLAGPCIGCVITFVFAFGFK